LHYTTYVYILLYVYYIYVYKLSHLQILSIANAKSFLRKVISEYIFYYKMFFKQSKIYIEIYIACIFTNTNIEYLLLYCLYLHLGVDTRSIFQLIII